MIALLAAVALVTQDPAFEAEAAELYDVAFAVGVCEQLVDRESVTDFLAEFMGVEPDWTNDQLMRSSNVVARGFVAGRRESRALAPTESQCVRSIEVAQARFAERVRERDPSYDRPALSQPRSE